MEYQQRQVDSEETEPELLYHYTDQKGLLGILGSKRIWATHLRYLNDTREGRIASEAIFNEISRRSNSGELLRNLGLSSDVPPGESDSSQEEILTQGLVGSVWATALTAFVTCFSKEGDSLSQWRAYSGPAGFSLGFHPDYLRMIGRSFLASHPNAFSSSDPLGSCTYYDSSRENSFKQEIEDLVAEYIRNAQAKLAEPGAAGSTSVASIAFENFSRLGNLSVLYKDTGFKEEREWRLAFLVRNNSVPPDLELRPGGSMLVPYVAVNMEIQGQPIGLDEIRVGPCPHPDESVAAVEMLLYRHGLRGVRVSRSKIPYRNW